MNSYKKAIELNPDYAEAYSSIGAIYFFNAQYDDAIEYFEKAIELDPTLATAYGNCALAYAMINDFENADKYLEHAKALGYSNYEAVSERIDDLR